MSVNNKFSDSVLTVDLGAIAHNYNTLKNLAKKAKAGAVVKANAYGLGYKEVSQRLAAEGCEDFFVATADEAIRLRSSLDKSKNIYVFHGVDDNESGAFAEHYITPVVNNFRQLEAWQAEAKKRNKQLNTILHIDTGMNRLGFNFTELEKARDLADDGVINIKYVMSHLACISENGMEDFTAEQMKKFEKVRKVFAKPKFSTPKFSLANSYGVISGSEYHFDLTRAGCALYGVHAGEAGLKHAITLRAKIIQLRNVLEDGAVGYGAAQKVATGAKLAVVPVGYADGYHRKLSSGELGGKSFAVFKGKKLPLVGRVSMDLCIFDASEISDGEIKEGDFVELIGENYTIDEMAKNAETIGYEILTSIASRFRREYV